MRTECSVKAWWSRCDSFGCPQHYGSYVSSVLIISHEINEHQSIKTSRWEGPACGPSDWDVWPLGWLIQRRRGKRLVFLAAALPKTAPQVSFPLVVNTCFLKKKIKLVDKIQWAVLPWWRSGWESANAGDMGSSPGLGRSHMLRSN